MNVNDQWMLNQMQQIAAGMAASVPQVGQNTTEAPKTDKGETFQDLMNKAKDQKVDAPKKDDTAASSSAAKKEPAQDEELVQKYEQAKQSQAPLYTKKSRMDAETAALVAAGYAEVVEVYEDGSLLVKLDGEMLDSGFAMVYGIEDASAGAEELIPIIITNAAGQEVMVTPKQIQDVLDGLSAKTPQDIASGDTLVGQIDLPEYEDMTVVTPDGKVTTLREAMAEAKLQSKPVEADTQEEDSDDSMDAEVTANSKPLFHDVKAAPVKVGENFQLDTEAADMDEQLAQTIQLAAQEGMRQVEIKLSPENLGTLTIKLTQNTEGVLEVVFHTSNAKAASLLNQHMGNLNAALQGYSQNEVRVEVQHNEDSQQADQQQTDPNGHNRQQQEQRQHQDDNSRSGDFVQRLRLGLFGEE